jgi:hypothetical protein
MTEVRQRWRRRFDSSGARKAHRPPGSPHSTPSKSRTARGYGSPPSRCGPAKYRGWSNPRAPGSRARSLRACQVLRPRRVARALALARSVLLHSAIQTASAPGICFLSRLNGWPARTPTDASPTPSRMPAHGSGPMWFAIPSSQWTCTAYSLPVSRRTCVKTLEAVASAQQKKRTCDPGESLMRERHSIRINLAPERSAGWFSHSQDPNRTYARREKPSTGPSIVSAGGFILHAVYDRVRFSARWR